MKEPGGFRRNFLSARAQERGEEEPPMIRNVVDFLFLYGHFVRLRCVVCDADGRPVKTWMRTKT